MPNKSRVWRKTKRISLPIRIPFIRLSQNPYPGMTLKRFSFYDLSGWSCVTRCKWNREKLHTKKLKVPACHSMDSNFPMCNVGFSLIFVLFLVDGYGSTFSSRSAPTTVFGAGLFTATIWNAKWFLIFVGSPSFRFNIERHEMCHKCNKYYLVEWACKLAYFFSVDLVGGGYMTLGVRWMPPQLPYRLCIDTSHTFQVAAGEHTHTHQHIYLVSHSGDVALAPPKKFSLALAFDCFLFWL